MKKNAILLTLLCLFSFSCKIGRSYKYIGSNCEKTISLTIDNDKILCPVELCGKMTVSLNKTIIDSHDDYYFLDSKNEVCFFDRKTKSIKSKSGEKLYHVSSFDKRSIVIVSVASGNFYEFVH